MPPRERVESVRTEGQTVILDLGGPSVAITVLTPRLLRFAWAPDGTFPPRRPWAVTKRDEDYEPVPFRLDEKGEERSVRTDHVRVTVQEDGTVAIALADGRELLRQASRPAWDAAAGRATWGLAMPDDRSYFGFGERTGLLEKRGRRYTAWTTDEWEHQGPGTDALYVAVPFHLGLDPDGLAHGIFLDTTFRSAFDLSRVADGELTLEAEAPGLGWYLFVGPDPRGVIEAFAELVGRTALPPRWALGYHQARWSYGSSEEVLDVARALRKQHIPADAIHLDIDHMDRNRPFTWDRERFPDVRALTGALGGLGFRTTAVVDAALPIADEYATYREARDRGYLVRRSREPEAGPIEAFVWGGRSVYPDHALEAVRRWWGWLHRDHVDDGIAGFLNDMNEPSMRDRPLDDAAARNIEPPPGTPHGDPELEGTHAEVRNLYALLMNRGTADFLRDARPDRRPFVITRSGFAGLQRDAILWTGDNRSLWEHLEMSVPQLLNLGLSGIPIAGADIGGFFESCTPELLVRWTQLGALYPFARNNSAKDTARQEPWAWGEPTTSRCRAAIELRYRLLPYLYTVVEEAVRTGLPVLRPLFLEFPRDRGSQLVGDQALLGRDLLIAPVLRPGQTSRLAYLPPGDWYDARSGRRHAGGQTIAVAAGLDDGLPLFARAGSVIPMAPVTQSTSERPDRLEVHVYPTRGRAAGDLYEDDGESTGYRHGLVARTRFEARRTGGGTRIRATRRGRFDPGRRSVDIVIHDRSGERRATIEDAAGWETLVP